MCVDILSAYITIYLSKGVFYDHTQSGFVSVSGGDTSS